MTIMSEQLTFDPKLDFAIERFIDAPTRLVWEALTKPEHLKEWYMPKAWGRVARAEMDLRPAFYRRTSQTRIKPATADPMPTARRIWSGIAIALFIARRIQVGLAANMMPSSTNRIPTPMRKSANAMDLIGW